MELEKGILLDLQVELKKLLKDKLKRIILFGSYAREDFDDESDIDILVLIDDYFLKEYDEEVLNIAVDLSIKYGIVITIFIEGVKKFEEEKDWKPFFKNINLEGKHIYAA